jgi:parvulin-like peptidyl-prolyl isomerase
VKRLLKEPLAHFVVLGALLFAGYGLLNRGDKPGPGRIVVTQGRIENLRATFSRVWQRPPSPAELHGLIQNYIREEVLAREAMALGLDRDDTVIRRLRQKVEFAANDLTAQAEPGEAELAEFLAKHPDLFRVEPRFTFRQVYLNADRRGDALKQNAERLLAELNRPGKEADFQKLGDATLLSPEFADVPADEVTREFGEEFKRQLTQLPGGRWIGPLTSGFGAHLVRVDERKPGRTPELSEIRAQVAREWVDALRREDSERFFQNLLKRYAVTINALLLFKLAENMS